jgi:biotin carboxyl carrier protein
MKYVITLEHRTWEVAVDGSSVSVAGREYHAELRPVDGTPLRLLTLDGRIWPFAVESSTRQRWTVLVHGERRELEVLDERTVQIRSLAGSAAAASGPVSLKAPMPGLVVRILAEQGQKVVEGESLIVLEAMKMENELKAVSAGVVDTIPVSRGQTVEKGQVLLTFAAGA